MRHAISARKTFRTFWILYCAGRQECPFSEDYGKAILNIKVSFVFRNLINVYVTFFSEKKFYN